MKEFNWEFAGQIHRPEVIEWLKKSYNKPMTFEEYAKKYRSFRVSDVRPYKWDRYSSWSVKKNYTNLKEKFGFFT